MFEALLPMPLGPILVDLQNVTLSRPQTGPIIQNLTWTLRDGETWAIVGPNASGKTTLAEALAGQHRIAAGEIAWPIVARGGAKYPSDVIRLVGFREDSRLFRYSGQYYQQRYEFADTDEPLTLEQYLRNGTTGDVRTVAEQLGIAPQLPLAFVKLSNGQTRRARIARGLLMRPELLILDEPFIGVDAQGRADLASLLGELVRQGQRLLLVTSGEVPTWVTDVQKTEAGGQKSEDRSQKSEVNMRATDSLASDHSPLAAGPCRPVLECENVVVRHGGRNILDGITWTVRQGERWALVGPNGAGKTTLLALACGDHPQAFSNVVRLFGKARGSGETIWDVKRRIGFVSPEFHLYFCEPLTAFEVATTGFFDVIVYREPSVEQAAAVRALFAAWGCEALLTRPFRQLSTSQQRLVLVVRALVKRPDLVILDEPFQGLDPSTAARIREWLDANLAPTQTLIFTTHIVTDRPRCITHELRLHEGRVANGSAN